MRLTAKVDALVAELDDLRRTHTTRMSHTATMMRWNAVASRLRQLACQMAESQRSASEAPASPASAAESDLPPVHLPPGHYYSAMYDARELLVEPARSRIWPPRPHERPGIDWREDAQRAFLVHVLGAQERLVLREDGEPQDGEYYAG